MRGSLVVVAVAVLLVGVPVLVVGSLIVRQQAAGDLAERAEALAVVVQGRHSEGVPVDLSQVGAILGTGPQGGLMHAEIQREGRPTVVVGARRSSDSLRARASAGTVRVEVSLPRSAVRQDVLQLVAVVLGFAVVAFALAAALALRQARRVSEPLGTLAENADRVGLGQSRLRPVATGVAELDRVAEGLRRSAESMAATLAAEREFATDASHQLRTPLTALSMRLEELAGSDDLPVVHDEARVAQDQVERLTLVVDGLLARARSTHRRSLSPVDVDAVLDQQLQEWRPAFRGARRRVVIAPHDGVRVLAAPGTLAQVVATLLENSLAHGDGDTIVRVRRTGRSVVLEVTDDGEGVPAELGARVFERAVSGRGSTGLGLALARDLAEAGGGRLELVRNRPPVFALFLPAADEV